MTEEFKAKWDTKKWENQTDTMNIYLPCSWQNDQVEAKYNTSDTFNYIPVVDVRSSVVYYPEALTHETSLSFWAYVSDAQARRASYEDPEVSNYRVMFNMPRFVPFDASTAIEEEDTVDVRGGDGIIEVLTIGAAGTDARVCVFDIAGDLVATGQAAKGYAAIEGIRDGKYTVIAFANNPRFSTIGSEGDLAAMGVDAAHYAKATGVVVKDGNAPEVSLSVPALAASTLSSVLNSSAVNIGKTDVMAQTEVYAAVSFTLKGSYSADQLTMKVPAGLQVTSVYSKRQDYQGTTPRKATFNSSSRTLTVDISDGKTLDSDGVHRLWVGLKPVLPGYYSVNASVKASGITAPIGSASFNSYAVSIDTPAEPVLDAQDTVVPITVHAAPGSYVTVTMGNKSYQVGPTNRNGSATQDINLWDAIRDDGQPAGVASFATSFLATASLEIGGVTYTDSGTVNVMRDTSTNVRLYDFSFTHAGATYDLVKDGREHRMGTYYTYVANNMTKNEYWTFKATFKSNQKLTEDATVQIQMLDGSSRYAKMKLVNQVYVGDALGGTWTAVYSTTVRIEQAGDHVFPSNLVPCGFDAFYGLDVTEDLPNQEDVNIVKWDQRLDVQWAAGPTDKERRAEALRELDVTMNDDDLTDIANADSTTALFNTFVGYICGGSYSGGGEQITGEQALDKYVEAMWETAKDDPNFRKTLEAAAPDGTTIPTGDSATDRANGKKKVRDILFGEGSGGSEGTGAAGGSGGVAGTVKDMGELMYAPETSGVFKKPSEFESYDDFVAQFLDANPVNLESDPDWFTMSDEDANNTLFQGLSELEDLLGTPSTGNDLTTDLAPPNKFGIKINRTDGADGIPQNYEIADSNGNHLKFNVPQVAREFMGADNKTDFVADKLKGGFKEYANEKLSGQKTQAALNAYKAMLDKEAAVLQKMQETGIAMNEELANTVANKAKQFWDSQWKGVADSVAAYDILKQKAQSWTWQDTLSQIEKAKAERDAAAKKAAQYAKNPSAILSDSCKLYLEALETAYGGLFKWLSEKGGALLSDYGMEALCMGLIASGNTSVAGKVGGVRALWKYGVGGVKTKVEKTCASLRKQAKNYWEWLNELCDPKKNASYQTTVILDPSGTVYEAVEGNTVSGVTATVYEVSGSAPVEWNVTEYDQVNPQTTGSDGAYGWNVPVGKWQVKFTKAGYEDATTGTLDVPPPQMGLSTPMFATTAPSIVAVNASPTYVEVVFDQYMNTTVGGTVYIDNQAVNQYEIEWKDFTTGIARDVVGGESNAKGVAKVLRVPLSGKSIGSNVKVQVVGFKNYSGIALNGGNIVTYDSVAVKKQPTSIEFVSGVGEESPLAVKVTNTEYNEANHTVGGTTVENDGSGYAVVRVMSGGSPLAGATVTASLDNGELAEVGTITGTTDSDGLITIPLTGKLPGMSVLTATAEGSVSTSAPLMTAFTDATQVARPTVKAGNEVLVGTGTAGEVWATVAPGTQLSFACATSGATIYYTTDGSCPCDDTAARIAYEGPITVSENMEPLRVRAMKLGLEMSENVTIHLTVSDGSTNKAALQTALNQANASPYTDAVRVSDDGSDVYTNEKWVTQEAKDALATDKTAAAAVAADASATQALIDEAAANLNAAMAGYVPRAGTEPLPSVLIDFSGATIDPIAAQTYTGKALTPKVTVRLNGKTLTQDTDYTVLYSNNTAVGTAQVTVTPTGQYSGTAKTATFTIKTASDPTPVATQTMYRLYNPNSGEHFYTASTAERDNVRAAGWNYEGVGWTAPVTSATPVYRLYNQYGGEHHYTTSASERDFLVKAGWNDEGIGWYSDDSKKVPLYRQYNPNQFSCNHNYTTSKAENDWLVSLGWHAEGIGWYGLS